MEVISSKVNPRVKHLKKLHDSKYRKENGLFVVEGLREVGAAIAAGIEIVEVYLCAGQAKPQVEQLISGLDVESVYLAETIFADVAYRQQSEILVVARDPQKSLNSIKLCAKPLVVVLSGIEKPGNIGAVLRTANAAGVDAVIITDSAGDIYNPNAIRASLGGIFNTTVVKAQREETLAWLRTNGLTIFAATPHDKDSFYNHDYRNPTALVLGSEADGLDGFWLTNADYRVLIPMYGQVDSLNISVSAAIMIYEALRQKSHGVG